MGKKLKRPAMLAAGALERPIAFPDNDRPGVMLAGGLRTYINRYADNPGARAVIFANTDGARQTAAALRGAGLAVTAVLDVRPGELGPELVSRYLAWKKAGVL